MTIIDTYPNVERAITYTEASSIFKREYEIFKSISHHIKEEIVAASQSNINDYNLIKYYLEKILRSSKYKLITNNTQKEIIIGNILLPNDYEIAELLNQNDFTIKDITAIIRFRSLLKNVILYSASIDEELEKQFKKYKQDITKIIEIFKRELNFDDQTVILNRITELLVTNPNYFESKNSEHTRKK